MAVISSSYSRLWEARASAASSRARSPRPRASIFAASTASRSACWFSRSRFWSVSMWAARSEATSFPCSWRSEASSSAWPLRVFSKLSRIWTRALSTSILRACSASASLWSSAASTGLQRHGLVLILFLDPLERPGVIQVEGARGLLPFQALDVHASLAILPKLSRQAGERGELVLLRLLDVLGVRRLEGPELLLVPFAGLLVARALLVEALDHVLDLGPELRGDPLDSGLGRLHLLRQQLPFGAMLLPKRLELVAVALFVLEKVGSLLFLGPRELRETLAVRAFEGRSARLGSLAQHLLRFRRRARGRLTVQMVDRLHLFFALLAQRGEHALVGRLKLLELLPVLRLELVRELALVLPKLPLQRIEGRCVLGFMGLTRLLLRRLQSGDLRFQLPPGFRVADRGVGDLFL